MHHRLDSRELSEWKAYDLICPLDHAKRIELACGTVAAIIYNSKIDRTKHDPQPASYFMKDWAKPYRAHVEADNIDQDDLASRIDSISRRFVAAAPNTIEPAQSNQDHNPT